MRILQSFQCQQEAFSHFLHSPLRRQMGQQDFKHTAVCGWSDIICNAAGDKNHTFCYYSTGNRKEQGNRNDDSEIISIFILFMQCIFCRLFCLSGSFLYCLPANSDAGCRYGYQNALFGCCWSASKEGRSSPYYTRLIFSDNHSCTSFSLNSTASS